MTAARLAAQPAALLLLALQLLVCVPAAYVAPTDAFGSLFPHNLTACIEKGRPPSLCAYFHAFASNASSMSGCVAAEAPSVAYGCMNASRCVAVYGVPACVGPHGFNFSLAAFNHSHCTDFLLELNATLAGNLTLTNETDCTWLNKVHSADDADVGAYNFTQPPPPPPLPEFHPCAGFLNDPHVERVLDVQRRAGLYTSHVVVALSPRIGPVAGGVTVGVCGLGFTQANEGVSHLACRFTDGYNLVDVPAVHVDSHQLRCVAPDFSKFAVGMPHNVSVEVSTSRGGAWTNNKIPFTFYSSRPAIDAFGRPIWGYDPTFTQSAWQVTFEENEYGPRVEELYPPAGHPLNEGRPSPWDAPRDPFHAIAEHAAWMPVELDTGDRMNAAEDLVMRTRQAAKHGHEGSWGDRMSFLRAHHLVPDTYRQDVVAARNAFVSESNGVM